MGRNGCVEGGEWQQWKTGDELGPRRVAGPRSGGPDGRRWWLLLGGLRAALSAG